MFLLFLFIIFVILCELGTSLCYNSYRDNKKNRIIMLYCSVFLVIIGSVFSFLSFQRVTGLLLLWDKKLGIVQPWEMPEHSLIAPIYNGELND